MSAPERWRLLPYHHGDSGLHFALSDALVRHVRVPTVWWHSTDQPTLILGAGQRWRANQESAGEGSPVRVVRRHAGGTAVYARSGVIGLDVALPAGHPLAIADVVEAYRWLGEVWVRATQTLGVPSRLVSIAEAREAARHARPFAEVVRLACFGGLSPYEVAVGGRKLVGLAQVRRRSGVLLQAGVHLHFDAESLATFLAPEQGAAVARALRRAALGLDESARGYCGEAQVMDAFHSSLQAMLGVTLEPGDWMAEELLAVATHAQSRP